MKKKKLPISLNGYSKPLNMYPDEVSILNIIYDNPRSSSVISNINEELKKKLKDLNNENFSLTINENELFRNVNYSKPFKLLDNKKKH